jgi:Zn-dependent peptidase ImmA (M78 family)
MFLSLATLAEYDYNKRRLTEDDFFAICKKRGVQVLEEDVATSFYFSLLGKEFIVISKQLTGVKRQFALFHELSHCLLGVRSNQPRALFMGQCSNKEEDEADAFACIALIPKNHLYDVEFIKNCCCGYSSEVWSKRMLLFQAYGI